jgi:RNA recognition motif-containing protein
MSTGSSESATDNDGPALAAGAETSEPPDKKETVTLYVLNVNFQSTQQALGERFSEFGKVLSAYIPVDKRGKSKGYGFVEYATEAEAQAAIETMNNQIWEGRTLHVELSRSGARSERRRGFDASRLDDRDRSDRSYRSNDTRSRRDRDRESDRDRDRDRDYRRDRDRDRERDRGRDRDRDRDRGRDRYSRDDRSDRRRRNRYDSSDSDSPPPRRRRSSRRSDSD